jgi:hypothetical protein
MPAVTIASLRDELKLALPVPYVTSRRDAVAS